MADVLKHKGYIGTVEASLEDECLHGKVLYIRDSISYGGDTISELKQSFEEAIDGYLEECEELGKQPDQPFSGTFNVRIGADQHRAISYIAAEKGLSINEVVCEAVSLYVLADSSEDDTLLDMIFEEADAVGWAENVIPLKSSTQFVDTKNYA